LNAPEFPYYLDNEAHQHINTNRDSKLMLNVFANELYTTGKARINSDDCFAALKGAYARNLGFYCNARWLWNHCIS